MIEHPPASVPHRTLRPRSAAFTVVLSLAMAKTALAIDSMLPAFDSIREQLGLDPEATDVALLVTVFIIGLGLGQLPAGLWLIDSATVRCCGAAWRATSSGRSVRLSLRHLPRCGRTLRPGLRVLRVLVSQ